MQQRQFLKWLFFAGAVGLIVSVCFLLTTAIVNRDAHLASRFSYPLNRVMRIAWPSSMWLMATEGIEGTAKDYLIILVAALANTLLYGVIGGCAWWICHFKRLSRSSS